MSDFDFKGNGDRFSALVTAEMFEVFSDNWLLSDYKSFKAFCEARNLPDQQSLRFDLKFEEMVKHCITVPNGIWIILRDNTNWEELLDALKQEWPTGPRLVEEAIQERAFDMFKVHLESGRKEAVTYLDECAEDNYWCSEDKEKVKEAYELLLQKAAAGKFS